MKNALALMTAKVAILPLYASSTKYESLEQGWPSFYQSLPDSVRTKRRQWLFYGSNRSITAVVVGVTWGISLMMGRSQRGWSLFKIWHLSSISPRLNLFVIFYFKIKGNLF